PNSTLIAVLQDLFDSTESLLPNLIEKHGGAHIAQAVFGDFAEFAFGEEIADVHAGDAVGFGGFDAECFAVKIQVEASRGAVASAHIVKGELLGEIAVGIGLVTVT